jgi:hypothetical protein
MAEDAFHIDLLADVFGRDANHWRDTPASFNEHNKPQETKKQKEPWSAEPPLLRMHGRSTTPLFLPPPLQQHHLHL